MLGAGGVGLPINCEVGNSGRVGSRKKFWGLFYQKGDSPFHCREEAGRGSREHTGLSGGRGSVQFRLQH